MTSIDVLRTALGQAPIVPVLTVADPAHGAPLARALVAGGLTSVEVTLRTPAALEVLKAMREAKTGLLVGAGTVLTPADVQAARGAGADFLVTPGLSPGLLSALKGQEAAVIPGAATASEAMARAEAGFDLVKLFPAEVAGGVALLRALAAPLPHLTFLPTGGITADTAAQYLALENVTAVGGSWIATPQDLALGDWDSVTDRARDAVARASDRMRETAP